MVVSIDKTIEPVVTPIGTDKSITPGLQFTLKVISDEPYYEIPIHIDGLLLSENDTIIATLSTHELPQSQTTSSEMTLVRARDLTHLDREFNRPLQRDINLIAWLNKESIDRINILRQKHDGDVFFKIQLSIITFYFNIALHHTLFLDPARYGLRKYFSVDQREEIMISTFNRNGFSSSIENGWLLSSYREPYFLKVYKYVDKTTVKIVESEWIKKFAPKLGLGTYFIVEVPAKGVLKDAWSLVEEAEEAFNRWDINSVYAKCREVGFLLDNLIQRSNLNDFVKKEKWRRAYGRFENLASLGLHIEELKKSPNYKPEDIKITPEDCRHLLIITKSLIKYAEDLGICLTSR
jgi:hypothetical protein